MKMAYCVAAALLAANALYDLCRRRILLRSTCFAGIIGMLRLVAEAVNADNPGLSAASALVACLPGMAVLMLSKMSRGGIGAGDGLILIATGLWTDLLHVCLVLVVGLFIASGFAAVCMVRGSVRRKEIPFVPFLFGAHLCVWLLV